MSNAYIRGCENSTLANVLPLFCTALGVQTLLYRDRILYSNEVQTPLYRDCILYRNAWRYSGALPLQAMLLLFTNILKEKLIKSLILMTLKHLEKDNKVLSR